MDCGQFAVSGLRCTVGNNALSGEHLKGYNGLFAMTSPAEAESAFVPAYAGLNLEHYFDGAAPDEDRSVVFEPRNFPMEFRRVGDTVAELHQGPTPHYGVESWTRFELKGPYYVDFAFRCIPRKDAFTGGFFGVFWASYINGPADKSIYFLAEGSTLDKPRWVQLCTQAHDRDSTVCHESDTCQLTFQQPGKTLFSSFSPLRYSQPFFYGRFRDMVLVYIFKPGPIIRFSHSPSGGGPTKAEDDTNPAWDFQLIVPDYSVGAEYALEGRLVYKPWSGRSDVIAEVRRYLSSD